MGVSSLAGLRRNDSFWRRTAYVRESGVFVADVPTTFVSSLVFANVRKSSIHSAAYVSSSTLTRKKRNLAHPESLV